MITHAHIQKRNTIGFGSYPEVSLADARSKRDEARTLLAQNIDPQVERKRVEQEHINSEKILLLLLLQNGNPNKILLSQLSVVIKDYFKS